MDPLVLVVIAVVVVVVVMRVFMKVTGLILKIGMLIAAAFLVWLLLANM